MGFTLAEVLITLGIIGVVASLTIPTLLQNNKNKVVEARLKKFYSAINQAILMAENDHGDKKIWHQSPNGVASFDDHGNPIAGSNATEIWFNTYLAPYLKIAEQKLLSDGSFIVYFPDGSALRQRPSSGDWFFYPGSAQKCMEQYGMGTENLGICHFTFMFSPSSQETNWSHHYNKGMEPYKYAWNGDVQSLYSGGRFACSESVSQRHYCTAIIQLNEWKIPDDYPFKVRY